MWTKEPYGLSKNGRWQISNGHIAFDIHLTIDGGSGYFAEKFAALRNAEHEDPERCYIVTPEEADEYAEQILKAVNAAKVKLPYHPE